jgi:outer membrane protein assembly factor BamD
VVKICKYEYGIKMHQTFAKKKLNWLLLLVLLPLLYACASDEEIEYQELTVYEIYKQANDYLEDARYRDAAVYFDEVSRQHPYSIWAIKSKLMASYSHYMNNKYNDAIDSLDRFIQVHPGNRDVAYAYYLKALCYYEQMSDVERDQDMTQKALIALEDIITRFPSSKYAQDATLKIDLTKDHLAGKEMTVGRFYLNQMHFLPAINRFKNVVTTYGSTTHTPEALFRLTESYIALGLTSEAQRTAAVLGHNYPGSDWYNNAYKLANSDQMSQKAVQINNTPQNDQKSWWRFW